ncbi:MAG: hypothetical protein ABR936_04690 [Bacteroidota bacterium]
MKTLKGLILMITMDRKDFLHTCSSCGALSLLGLLNIESVSAQENTKKRDDVDNSQVNKNQVRQLLKFIDSSINESDKERIFQRLGFECLYSTNFDKWVIIFKDKQDEFFNRVKRGESKYWEKLKYDKEKSIITLIGRKGQTCACQFGRCYQPPKSICKYCCKRFQEELFGVLQQQGAYSKEVPVNGNKLAYSFPAHSFVQIKVKVEK